VSCHFHEGVLTLRGRVGSYYLKQVAQTLVRSLESVRQVSNQLMVISSDRDN
jgi:osmotically-inducible protein OsmY